MADRYAPALFLQVLAFWFVLRWLLLGRLVLFFGRVLVLIMVVGVLGTLAQRHYRWAACFAASGLLAWSLLRRWRRRPTVLRRKLRVPAFRPWRGKWPSEVATLCERRIGLHVDAAAPATVIAQSSTRCVLPLAGDGVWVLEDESRLRRVKLGRVVACRDGTSLVAHVAHSGRRDRFELSWPRHGALVRGVMPSGPAADLLAGHLAADAFALG